MTISSSEYWNEVQSIAQGIAAEAMGHANNDREWAEEDISDHWLHETIDSHQWIIYTCYHLPIIQHSDNADYMQDNFGAEGTHAALEEGGIDGLHTAMAFWALYADVQSKLQESLDKVEEGQEA